MIITNSLGSNYTPEDRNLALKLLFQLWIWRKGKETEELKKKIATLLRQPASSADGLAEKGKLARNDTDVKLFLKGRQAIKEALKQLNIVYSDEVIVQAFTCVAVVEPILDLGAIPIYADIAPHQLNPTLENIKKVVTSRTKAVILQHTLGYINPENEKICVWCQKNHIAVIQDLAHAVGAESFKNSSCETRAVLYKQPIILSFSQDKVFDGITGGALISPYSVIPAKAGIYLDRSRIKSGMTTVEIFKIMSYPLITYAIRSTYNLGIGKTIHFLAKKLGLLTSPIYTPQETSLPNAFATLALQQFIRLDKIIKHRKEIALQYNELINNKFKVVNKKDIENGSNLRYPLYVNNRDELENKLKKHNFYLMDHWYDTPVAPKKYISSVLVKYRPRSCPNAENLSDHIFNLPTHVNINLKKAKELSELINQHGK